MEGGKIMKIKVVEKEKEVKGKEKKKRLMIGVN